MNSQLCSCPNFQWIQFSSLDKINSLSILYSSTSQLVQHLLRIAVAHTHKCCLVTHMQNSLEIKDTLIVAVLFHHRSWYSVSMRLVVKLTYKRQVLLKLLVSSLIYGAHVDAPMIKYTLYRGAGPKWSAWNVLHSSQLWHLPLVLIQHYTRAFVQVSSDDSQIAFHSLSRMCIEQHQSC